jgi:Copper type II ascorbate-dependent monooxygenase, C-terminal domain
MKRLFSLLLSLIVAGRSYSQTWADNVAPIIYSKCVSCHRPNSIAPFSLLTYTDAFNSKLSISTAVSSRHMPPWPPDDSYVHFTDARVLTTAQISTIVNWVNAGAPSGNLANAPAPPLPVTNQLGVADVTLKMPNYTSTAASGDIYQCFVLPLRLGTEKYISAAEIIPGNNSIVHHVLLYQDTTANHAAQQIDNSTPEPGYISFGGIGVNSAVLLDAWVPGNVVRKSPVQFGRKIYANSDLVMQIHYPAGSSGILDSTKVRLYYNSNPLPREVRIEPILNHFPPVLTNGPINIPPNTSRTYDEQFTIPLFVKASVLSVAPHMHLVGEKIKVWANKTNGDTIRLIDIPHWDFHWQGSYYFQKPVVVDPGTTLKATATYNNTTSNPHNPNNPPQTITLGEATTNEMMLVYFAFTAYQPGDENIILDSSLLVTPASNNNIVIKQLKIFPNPAGAFIQFENPEQHKKGILTIWSMDGKKVYEEDITHLHFVNIVTRHMPAGVYNIYLKANNTLYADKVVIQH